MTLLVFFICICILAWGITTLICGHPREECIAAMERQGGQIFVFRWHGLYYAESWQEGKDVPFIRERTRFALTKDSAIELAQWDIRTANAMASWDD